MTIKYTTEQSHQHYSAPVTAFARHLVNENIDGQFAQAVFNNHTVMEHSEQICVPIGEAQLMRLMKKEAQQIMAGKKARMDRLYKMLGDIDLMHALRL